MQARAATQGGRSGQARLLDVTRLVSRAGRVPTGIDRVERAWLARLIADETPVFGLLRTPFGFVLLDRRGLVLLDGSIESGVAARPDLLSRLSSRRPEAVRAMESALRRVALGRCLRHRLRALLTRHLPEGVVAFNVGHANLTERSLAALKAVPGLRIVVMIHDTIPLDFPEFQREGASEAFAAKFRVASRQADAIICPSQAAAEGIVRHLEAQGSGTRVTVAPLGVEPVVPRPDDLPSGVPPDGPYFVVLGTIEPRKNHALLLDVWEMLGPDAPWLLVCGSRGWRNAETFARLDRHPARVRELPGLSDGAVAALLDKARGLLFPSLAEGFGLPLVEAAAHGTPVICSDLAVCREVAGPGAQYLDPRDPAAWAEAVLRLNDDRSPRNRTVPPTWEEHFNIALGMA